MINEANLAVTVTFTMLASGLGSGFGMNYVLGTTNDGIDTTPPPAPGVPDLDPASDTGASNADNLTSVTTPLFSGTAEANATITLLEGATVLGTGKADLGGHWSVRITTPLMGEGTHLISATATDAAGNTGPVSGALSLTIDTTAPAIPTTPNMTRASDSGASSGDDITNITTPTFVGTAEAGSKVFLYAPGGLIGSTKASSTGTWTIRSNTVLADGRNSIAAYSSDAAGNSSALSSALNVTIDTAGQTPSVPDLAAVSDSGASDADNVTNVTTPTFTGTSEAGATVTLLEGDTQLGSGRADSSGKWVAKIGIPLSAGMHAISARIVDLAGNASAISAALPVIIDITKPAPPTRPDLVASDDTGASNTDNITNRTVLTLVGNAEAGTTVNLLDRGVSVGTAKADGAGLWTLTTGKLDAGVHALRATAMDVAGNASSLSATLNVTVDLTPDAAPGIVTLSRSAITGTAPVGTTVTLFDGGTNIGKAVAGSVGTWTLPTALAAGRHALSGTTTDKAGNVSARSAVVFAVLGTAADDVLTGTADPELMSGAAGADRFVFTSASASPYAVTSDDRPAAGGAGAWYGPWDVITDFTPGLDSLDLSALNTVLTGVGPTRLTWNGLVTGSGIDLAAGLADGSRAHAVWYGSDAGMTYVYADTSGDGHAEVKLQLLGNPVLGIGDFVGLNARAAFGAGGADGSITERAGQTGSVELDTVAGTLPFSDADLADVHTVSVTAGGSSYLGTLTASVTEASGKGEVGWTFSVQDRALDFLGAGKSLVQSYAVALTDSAGATTIQTITITLTGLNDAPTTTTVAFAPMDEDGGTVLIGQLALLGSAKDPDGPSLQATALTIASGGGTLLDMGGGSWAYTPALNDDTEVTFSYIVTDGSLNVAGAATLDLTPVNDAPVNTVPAELGVAKNTALAIAGLSVGDVDAGGATITTTLSVALGTLTIASAGGATVSGSGTGTVTLTGSQTQINTTLAAVGNVVYQGMANVEGTDTLTMTTNDGGNSGSGGARSDTDTVAITVGAPSVLLAAIAAGAGGFVINGQCVLDISGWSVASAGDVNGDGLADLIVGAPWSDPAGRNLSGQSYVVFGRTGSTAVDLSAVASGIGGFVINGQCVDNQNGKSVASAGDVNGDGLADLIIGAPYSDPTAGRFAGRSYVVFGRTVTTAVDLSAVASGIGGFVMNGQGALDVSGISVAGAGDVNGDGLADLIVGARGGDPAGGTNAGRSYVVFGRTETTAVDVSAVGSGTGGFVINGQSSGDQSGTSVAGAGDVNGDGLADLIVGAPGAGAGAGRSFVVFGRTEIAAVDLSAVSSGTGGFVINGRCASDYSGWSVTGAGDVNGDGLADLIVGAYRGSPAAGKDAGRSYVVFGRTGTAAVDLSAVAAGSGGFVINGQCKYDVSGRSVASAGDVNGDGLADLIVGASRADTATGKDAGRSYVVFGRTGTTAVDLSAVASGTGGFVINGRCLYDLSGSSVASAGDVNGDGLADLIVGAPRVDTAAGSDAGQSYVIFGSTAGAFRPTSVDQLGTSGDDTLTGSGAGETIVGGAGDDTIAGNGGADVLYGGAGNDVIVVTASNIVALGVPYGSGDNVGQLARVDGGTGIDTIRLAGSGIAFALSAIANQGGGGSSSVSRINSVERIELTGSGDNTLSVTARDIIDMAGSNSFNNANGWADGTYNLASGGANAEQRHQLVVDGNAGDVVSLAGDLASWSSAGTVTNAGIVYNVYNQGNAQLIISGTVSLANIAPVNTIPGGLSVNEDTAIAIPALSVRDWDAGNATITTTLSVLHGTLTIGSAGDATVSGSGTGTVTLRGTEAQIRTTLEATGNVVYQGAPDYNGFDTLRMVTNDGGNTGAGGALSDTDLFTISLFRVNDAPVNTVPGAQAVMVDASLAITGLSVSDVDAIDLPITTVLSVQHGKLTIASAGGATVSGSGTGTVTLSGSQAQIRTTLGAVGNVVYQGAPDYVGNDTLTMTTNDGGFLGSGNVLSDTDTVAITVKGISIPLSAIAAGVGGFVINGQGAGDSSGFAVAGAGDVNGDGLADLIVGAYLSDPAAGANAGRSYVVFGGTGTTAVDLSAVASGIGGFVINGQAANDRSGISVASAGDVNGDGLTDLLVGATRSDPAGGADAGRSYVVFGRTATAAVDLSALVSGTGGFVINGQSASDQSGRSVAGAGDVNGDGLADLIVGAYLSDPAGGTNAGRSYVVFGRTGTTAVDLSAVVSGTGGFVISGQGASDQSGLSVSGAGDMNGDGLADLIVGAPPAGTSAGRSYVVFGRTETATVDLSSVASGTGGFVINGQCASDQSGRSVAGAGDVNGDGLADLIVGAFTGDPAAGADAGRSYVVFGRTGTAAVDLSAVASGTGGFVINGQSAGDRSGRSVASAGDMNGDGLADLIVGAPLGDPPAGSSAGRSYVVFGRTGTTAVDLSAVAAGTGGFVVNGQSASDLSGLAVASAGDVNGDGLADLIVGAYASDPAAGGNAGRSYVIFGSTNDAFRSTAVDQLGTSGDDTLSGTSAGETIVGGAGDDAIIGNGGADVLYGGAGNDVFVLDASNIAALVAPFGGGGNIGQLARIDGGTGIDTIRLAGGGISFALDAIAQHGAGGPAGASRIAAVERIELTGSGANTLSLSVRDVIDMAGMNSFNNASGWADGTYDLAAGGSDGGNPEQRHQLVVDGNADDSVIGNGWGASVGTVTNGGHTYAVYNQGSFAQLLIDTAVTRVVA